MSKLYIYTDPDTARPLEKEIQKQTLENFGYKFKWSSASAGNSGNSSLSIDLIKKLTSDEILDIIPIIKEIAAKKNYEEFVEKLKEV